MTRRSKPLTLLSLFSGAGGLDLGLEAAGFRASLCVENDEDARATLRHNRPEWRLCEPGDIHELHPDEVLRQTGLRRRQLTLLAGGPPCQPFSKSAYWSSGDGRRLHDPRARTLQAYVDIVEAALPQVLLLENVQGLVYTRKDEGMKLLERGIAAINHRHNTRYVPQIIHLNAADYGVPQLRERVFIVASREGRTLKLPSPTHGDGRPEPYLTAWDAIGELDCDIWPSELNPTGRWSELLPSIPEGHNYLWHTPRNKAKGAQPLFGWRTRFWSFLLKLAKSQPAWTIQAQPGPATGPFHWRNRLLSIEELCRLQTFPSGYQIEGSRRSKHRQVGNAVPSALGEFLGLEMRRQFFGEKVRRRLRLLPQRHSSYPLTERVAAVPAQYMKLCSQHKEHPGTGLGPAARRRAYI
jgi:DNA (cytosine-5)-methyltransferase 1